MADLTLLSTSRLAKLLNIELAELFRFFVENTWIERVDEQWQLKPHGELEGGSYQQSEQYGRYIVWPASIVEHPVLRNIGNTLLTTRMLAQLLALSAPLLNLLFAELGWIERQAKGWMITPFGEGLGAAQRSGKFGFYVVWPQAIVENKLLQEIIINVQAKQKRVCLDGLSVSSLAEQKINNYLYLAHIARAWRRVIPSSSYTTSFYLPQARVYLDYWGIEISSGSLSERMEKQAFIKANGLRYIDLNDDDMAELERVLPQKLLNFGVELQAWTQE